MTLTQFISSNNLKPADAVELVCPQAGFPKHYAVYLGYENGMPKFIANIMDGVQILSNERLTEFVKKYQVTNIERFSGNYQQRLFATRRGVNRIGEKAYNIVFNNCEHFKNWVLNGEDKSKQVVAIGRGIAISGVLLYLLGEAFDRKSLKKSGGLFLIVLIVAILVAFVVWQLKQNRNK